MLLIWGSRAGIKHFLKGRSGKVKEMRLLTSQLAETPASGWELGIQLQIPRKALKSLPTTNSNVCSAGAAKVPQRGASVPWSWPGNLTPPPGEEALQSGEQGLSSTDLRPECGCRPADRYQTAFPTRASV